MKKDIKLSGVGGQGILSIATVIGEAATEAGLQLKQAEVHGMSQRGGDVQSDLRLSTEEIFSDQISLGKADLIVAKLDIEQMAKDNQVPKSANMILLGMATRYIEILTPEQMRSAIARIFARKGEQVVNDNLKAFDLGYENIQ